MEKKKKVLLETKSLCLWWIWWVNSMLAIRCFRTSALAPRVWKLWLVFDVADFFFFFFSLHNELAASVISICSYLVFWLVIMIQASKRGEVLNCLWSAGTRSRAWRQQTGIQCWKANNQLEWAEDQPLSIRAKPQPYPSLLYTLAEQSCH